MNRRNFMAASAATGVALAGTATVAIAASRDKDEWQPTAHIRISKRHVLQQKFINAATGAAEWRHLPHEVSNA